MTVVFTGMGTTDDSFSCVRATLSAFAGRLVTSPLAFFVGFVIELAAYWLSTLRRRRQAS